MRIELLWFADCPNHDDAERLLRGVLQDLDIDAPIDRIEVPDEASGRAVCFPGSPTIRIDGRDVEPGWEPCADCTPRCRIYLTPAGLAPLPPRAWIEDAVRASAAGA